jgi:hypothetical protein
MGRAFSPSPDPSGWLGFPGPLAQAGMVRAFGAEAEDEVEFILRVRWFCVRCDNPRLSGAFSQIMMTRGIVHGLKA